MKQNTPANIVSVGKADEGKAIATVALAFASDPMMRWSFPDPEQFFEIAEPFLRAFGSRAFEHGTADATANLESVALWLPPNIESDGEAMMQFFEKARSSPETKKDGEGVFEQMNRFHPKEPHWYLPLIGADPVHQGKGYGAALMAHAMQRCDESHLPAYLESSKPSNVPFYERFGFKVMGTIQQGSSPVLTPMIRQAR
ncbi:MAG: GNAT family N-acetyltransferase [Xanthobacteraceae bacterium]